MKKLLEIGMATLKGGLFFLVPIVLLIVLFEKALKLLAPLVNALQNTLGLDAWLFASPYAMSIVVLVLICFIAGWIAKMGPGQRLVNWIETHILTLFPGYRLMKTTFESKVGIASEQDFPVVLVPIDGLMFGFHVDTLDSGDFVVFVPGAPTTWEGNVIIFPPDKVTKTNYKKDAIIKIMRQLGHNTSGIIKT
ncbi:DUF502 domain-containing protein [Algoriphagus namhaensis]